MAMVRLTCDGCGANLDAIADRNDPQAIVACGYCGANNRLRRTTDPQLNVPAIASQPVTPTWPPPPSPASGPSSAPQVSATIIRLGWVSAAVMLVASLVPMVMMTLTKLRDAGFDLGFDLGGGAHPTAPADGRPYTWHSAHPFVVDLDGDGHDDVLGLIQSGDGRVWLVALSGADWTPLWQREVGRQRGLTPADLRLYFEPTRRLAWLAQGRRLTDFDAQTGDERLQREHPATIEGLAVTDEQLWVELDDGRAKRYSLDGFNDTWAFAPDLRSDQRLRDDRGFTAVEPSPARDLAAVEYHHLRLVASYCLDAVAPLAAQVVGPDCPAATGLAWAEADDRRPVLVGYEPDGKAERWRVELESSQVGPRLRPGTRVWAAAIDSGDAVVAFAPERAAATRLRRFSRLDGAYRWEVVVVGDRPGQLEGLQVVGDRIYLVQAGVLHVREAETGAIVEELGG